MVGVTCDSLSCDGTTLCLREVLWISERTGASSQANSFQILLGTTSGPGDLFNFTWLKALKVFLVSTRNSLGTSSTPVVGLVPQGSQVCSKISQEGVEKLTKYSRRGFGIIQHLIIPVMRVLSTCDPFYFFLPPLNIRIVQCCYLVIVVVPFTDPAFINRSCRSNGYPSKFIKNIQAKKTRSSTTTVSPEELVGMFFKMAEPTESCRSEPE